MFIRKKTLTIAIIVIGVFLALANGFHFGTKLAYVNSPFITFHLTPLSWLILAMAITVAIMVNKHRTSGTL